MSEKPAQAEGMGHPPLFRLGRGFSLLDANCPTQPKRRVEWGTPGLGRSVVRAGLSAIGLVSGALDNAWEL